MTVTEIVTSSLWLNCYPLLQMSEENGGDKRDEASDDPKGEEPRRRVAQVRRRGAFRRPEKPSGSAAEDDGSVHDMLHIRDHGQSERRDVDASERDGGYKRGSDTIRRAQALVQGHDDQLSAAGTHVGTVLRERHVHGGRVRGLLQR